MKVSAEQQQRTLQMIGYWCGPWAAAHWPDPELLVGWSISEEERELLIRYLSSGPDVLSTMGFSSCRFSCGIEDDKMGCANLSDGVWVWPEGLAHYVEAHDVALPEAFLDDLRSRDFAMPLGPVGPFEWDDDHWCEWWGRQIVARQLDLPEEAHPGSARSLAEIREEQRLISKRLSDAYLAFERGERPIPCDECGNPIEIERVVDHAFSSSCSCGRYDE